MLTQDYLSLRLVRLKPAEEWVNNGPGLSFVFPKGGGGKFISGPVTQRLAPGDVFVLDGALGGKLCVADQAEMVFRHFSVSCEHLFPLFASSEICLLQSVTDEFKRSKLYAASSTLARECHGLLRDVPPQFNLDHRSQLLRVAAAILSVEFKNAHGRRVGFVRVEEHMIQVFEKLSVSEILGLSVGELANKFGCSRRHLNRLFHHHFGVSVATLRMELRLSKAVSLLRNPDAKVIRVAEECGFNHLGLFNTCFKRRFGTSPGRWRKATVPAAIQPAVLPVGDPACPMRISGLCPWSGKIDNHNPPAPAVSQTQKAGPKALLKGTEYLKEGVVPHVVANQQKIPESLYRPDTFQVRP
jgi:AraC-like DNA-binding protein